MQSQRLVRHVLFYMDDFVVIGAREADAEKAMRMAVKFAKDELGLEIKEHWGKIDLKYGALDMMGYVVSYGGTKIRRRIYKRLRRQFLRAARDLETLGFVPHWRARKLTSYKGYFIGTNTRRAAEKLNVWEICKSAQKSISYADAVIAASRAKGAKAA